MKILIVDDVLENRELLSAVFRSGGYEVATAADGQIAYRILRKGGVDCVISDILMPNLDGFQLCRKVKTNPRFVSLPFIIYSATYVDPEDVRFAKRVGADEYLIKPEKFDQLLKKVAEVLQRKKPKKPSLPNSDLQYLKSYSQRIVRKLEQKIMVLEKERKLRKKALQDATRANEAKAAFISLLGHELRTPLAPVLMTVSSLKRKKLPPELAPKLLMIEQNIMHEIGLINDLLDLTDALKGKLHLQTERCSFNQLVRDSFKGASVAEGAMRFQLSVNFEAAKDQVKADPGRMRQVLKSLLDNAFKLGVPGSTIHVRTFNRGQRVCFEITNTGSFIKGRPDTIFEPFEQQNREKGGSRHGTCSGQSNC